jgi:hypothetical protein
MIFELLEFATMYYAADRRPEELGKFNWVIDAKGTMKPNEWEEWWSKFIFPAPQTRSFARPFRQLPDGTIERQVYCPKCRNPMTTPAEDFLPYRCAPCHYLSPLKGFDFPSILEELPAPALHGA